MIKEFQSLAFVFILAAASCAPQTNPAQTKALDAGYEQGRRVFYDAVKQGVSRLAFLIPDDRNDLVMAEKAYPGLYEQLMAFYPYAAQDVIQRAPGPQAGAAISTLA